MLLGLAGGFCLGIREALKHCRMCFKNLDMAMSKNTQYIQKEREHYSEPLLPSTHCLVTPIFCKFCFFRNLMGISYLPVVSFFRCVS